MINDLRVRRIIRLFSLKIGSQYSDYMVLDYSCLQGPSLSVCDYQSIKSSYIDSHQENRLFLRSPNYPNEYENSLNCSCHIDSQRSSLKFLDFYLEERDEMNLCSRDRLQFDNRSYCGSNLEDQKQLSAQINLERSTQLTFKSNDVITRKGFWLMIASEQPFQVSCINLFEVPSTTTTSSSTETTPTTTLVHSIIPIGTTLKMNDSPRINPSSNFKRRHTLSYVLLLTIIFVVILLLANLILMILCWKQRRSKEKIDSKSSSTSRPFFCSGRSSSSTTSSVTYGETPVLTSLDTHKHSSTSSRYIFQPNHHQLDSTPSTSMTTTTTSGPYEDLHDSFTMPKTLSKQKSSNEHSLYMQQRQLTSNSIASPHSGYNRMIHFPPAPVRCHFSVPAQTFYPPQPYFDSQHVYETIQDGQCPYQRLAATLRRPTTSTPSCTCYYEHNEQISVSRTLPPPPPLSMEINPETLV